MQIHNAVITGSFSYNGADLSNVTSSNQSSASLSTRVTQIEQVYATTGSNSFRATQSITGSLTVTGQITAQTLNVQQVTSSIVYSSGSNVFGCDLNSRQTFTGSVLMTGSLTVNTSGTEFQVTSTGVNFGNALTDTHNISGSLRITGSSNHYIMGCGLGIGITTPNYLLQINSTNTAAHIQLTNCTTGNTITDGARLLISNSDVILNNREAGFMAFETADTERMRITSCGNVGIGITPAAWRSTDKVLQINNSSLYDENGTNLWLGLNFYENAAGNYIFNNNGFATAYRQDTGTHKFFTSNNGTAGGTVSFSTAFQILNNGIASFTCQVCSPRFQADNYGIFRSSAFRGGLFTYDGVSGAGTDYSPTIFAEGGVGGGNFYITTGGSATINMAMFCSGITCFRCQVCAPSGVKFGNGSGTLNYYEEGTFTPHFCSAGLSGITYGSAQNGYYTRIGRLVFISVNIMTSALTSTGTNNAVTIRCLPFTSAGLTESAIGLTVHDNSRYDSCPPTNAGINPNESFIRLYMNQGLTGAGTDPTPLYNQGFSNGGGNRNITRLSGVYVTN